jgi:hypothetical protein
MRRRSSGAVCGALPVRLLVPPLSLYLRCDAVLRCGVDVRLFLLSRFKRFERNSWDPVTSTPCIPTPHSSPHDASDAVHAEVRCGRSVVPLITLKRLERNKQGRSLVYTMHSHALNPLLSREPTNPLHLSQSSPLWECF